MNLNSSFWSGKTYLLTSAILVGIWYDPGPGEISLFPISFLLPVPNT